MICPIYLDNINSGNGLQQAKSIADLLCDLKMKNYPI